jgi:hypothetical protein
MRHVLGDLPFVEIYMDDFIVHSRDFDTHLGQITQVLDRLAEANLKVNPKKFFIFKKEIKLLGHIVKENTLMMDPSKLEAVSRMQRPKTVRAVRSALGLFSYYRKFILKFSELAKPMNELLRAESDLKWTPECDAAFNILKEKLLSYPVLRLPDPKRTFLLITDNLGPEG